MWLDDLISFVKLISENKSQTPDITALQNFVLSLTDEVEYRQVDEKK